MQDDQTKKLLKPKEAQNFPPNNIIKKNTYKYISKHHAQFREQDLRDQIVKRRDVVRWNFIGDVNKNMRMKRLVDMMRKMKRIKEFLSVTAIKEETTSDFAQLSEAIKRQRGLQKIYISLMYMLSKYVNEKQAYELAQGIQRVRRIKDIHISFSQGEFSDEGFNVLSESFKRLCALNELSVEFHNTDNITDKGLKGFSEKVKRVDSLRNILIKSCSKGITNEGLQELGQNLKRIKLLEHTSLNFRWQDMNGLGKLSEVLKEIPQLQKTTIDFSTPYSIFRGDDLVTQYLSPGLPKFKSFKNLSLKRLSLSEITDDGLKLFCETLEKLEFLQELDLNVYCPHVTKKGFEFLRETFKKLAYLKTFDFTLHLCQKLTDDDILVLSEGIKELQSLESMSFWLKQASVVTNKGLRILTEGLKQVKSLKALHLDLYGLEEINDEGINLVTRDFKELGLLKDVSLKFEACPKITNESLKILKRNFNQIPSLRYVRLRILDCEQIGLKETLEWEESLNKKFICKIRHSFNTFEFWAYPL